MKKLSNIALIERLTSTNPKDNEEALTYLYTSLYGKVQGFVLNNSGQKEEVKDLFQDPLLVFFKLAKRGKVDQEMKAEAYIFSTCRNLWLKKLQQKKKQAPYSVEEMDVPIEDVLSPTFFTVDKTKLLSKVLAEIGKGCQAILLAFYYEQQSMEEITKQMDLSSIQVAKNKKYKCLKRLQKLVMSSDYYKNSLR